MLLVSCVIALKTLNICFYREHELNSYFKCVSPRSLNVLFISAEAYTTVMQVINNLRHCSAVLLDLTGCFIHFTAECLLCLFMCRNRFIDGCDGVSDGALCMYRLDFASGILLTFVLLYCTD